MDVVLVTLSLAGAVCAGLGLVLTRIGLRYLTPLQGAATSLTTTALMFLAGIVNSAQHGMKIRNIARIPPQ